MIQSPFADGEAYENPFLALSEHGPAWVAEGMSPEEMTAAAIELGGAALGRNGPDNLTGLAKELRQLQRSQGEQ